MLNEVQYDNNGIERDKIANEIGSDLKRRKRKRKKRGKTWRGRRKRTVTKDGKRWNPEFPSLSLSLSLWDSKSNKANISYISYLFLSLFCIFPSLYLSHHQTPNISLWVKYTSIFIILDILTCNKINVFWKKNIFKCLNYNKILIKIYNK